MRYLPTCVPVVTLVACMTMSVSRNASAGLADEVLTLTDSAPMRIVWCRETAILTASYIFEDSTLQLMKFDTAVGAVEVLAAGPGSYQHPLITPDGQQVLYFDYDTNKIHIINWDGSGEQEFCSGFLYDVFRDDSGVDWVVVNDWIHVWNRPQPSGSVNVRKVRLDNPAVEEVILTYSDQKGETFDVSRDCSMGGGLLVHPVVGVYDLGTGAFSQRGSYACNTDVAPDNSYMFWHMQGGGHTNVVLYHNYPSADNRTVWLNNAPNLNGAESWSPRWTNNVRFFTMTGPIAWTAGSPRFNIYVGRFDAAFTQIEAWVQLTDNDLLDGNANGWVGQAGPHAPSIVSSAPTQAYVGIEYTYAPSVSGTPAPTYTVSGEPAWLMLSGNALSGTPRVSDVGPTGSITVTATNSEGTDTQTFQIEVVSGDSSLVGYWSFDEQSVPGADGSIFLNDGTPQGDAAWTADGAVGGALALSGAGSLSVQDSPSLDIDDLTFAAWVKWGLPMTTAQLGTIVSKNNRQGVVFQIGSNGNDDGWGGIELVVADSVAGWTPVGVAGFAQDVWIHVAVTYDATTGARKFYSAGTLLWEDTQTPVAIPVNAAAFLIGASSGGNGFNGTLDEVRLYNRVLTDQEVADLFSGASDPAPAITSTPTTIADVDAPYTYTVAATGDPAPTILVSGEPTWLTLTGNMLAGTPGASDIGATGTITVTATNTTGTDTQTFSITVLESSSILVESPEAGDVWYVGTVHTIRWTAVAVDDVTIHVYDDASGSWAEVVSSLADTSPLWGALEWTVPNTPSTDCLVRIRDYYVPMVQGSSGAFEIRAVTDIDGDGMDDVWENAMFGTEARDGMGDFDGDGVFDAEEFAGGTDPTDPADPLDPAPGSVAPSAIDSDPPGCAAAPGKPVSVLVLLGLAAALSVTFRRRTSLRALSDRFAGSL